MFIQKMISYWLIILITVLLSACNKPIDYSDDALSALDSRIYYTPKIRLPPGAQVLLLLEEISEKKGLSTLISSSTMEVKSNPPYALQLLFPTKLIKLDHHYNLYASISLNNELLFVSTTRINPFLLGITHPIKIKVDRVLEPKRANELFR